MLKALFTLGLLALLAACSTLPSQPSPAPTAPQDVSRLLNWKAEGKLGLRFREKGGSVYFTWQQEGETFTLDMAGPLGQGQTRLSGSPGQVSLENASTGHVVAATPEEVMLNTLGWQAPVSHLRYWMRGLPATAKAELQRNEAGELTRISEDGWQADIQRYADAGGYHLPSKLVITGPDTKVTVLVSDWHPAR